MADVISNNNNTTMADSHILIIIIIPGGADSNTAIWRIYEVYGVNNKISHVLKEMAAHELNGGHMLLRSR